jgi:hypothetical protein
MSQPLTYYCDTPHTQQLMSMFGDRLQNLDRSNLLDLISTISAACNPDTDNPDDPDYTIQQYIQDMDLITTSHMDTILEILDGFDCRKYSALLLGLAAMNHDRGNR